MKANGYGHGAVDVARAALAGGATALCVATVEEALELRAAPALDEARLLVMGPATDREVRAARAARLELVLAGAAHSRRHPRAPEDRHRDGPLGPLGAPFSDEERRRRHEPSRRRRVGCGLHEPADRQVSSGDGRARRRSRPPHREQRRNAAVSAMRRSTRCVAASRCTASPRSTSTLPSTGSSPRCAGIRTSRSRSVSSPETAPGTGGATSRTSRPGSASCRSGTRTGSVAT